MKAKLKGIIIGMVIGSLFVVTSVFATARGVQKILEYNDIKISLDGVEVKPSDANGNYVEPFIIDGTTYLPVRAVANALGIDVEWDGNTKNVVLSTPKNNKEHEELATQKVKPDYTVYERDIHDTKIIYTGVTEDVYSTSVSFMVEYGLTNKIGFVIEELKVNGKDYGCHVIGETFAREGNNSKHKVEFVFFKDHLAKKEIDTIKDIEFIIKVKSGGVEGEGYFIKTGKIYLTHNEESVYSDGFDISVVEE